LIDEKAHNEPAVAADIKECWVVYQRFVRFEWCFPKDCRPMLKRFCGQYRGVQVKGRIGHSSQRRLLGEKAAEKAAESPQALPATNSKCCLLGT
jgi:hypothetical protein